MGCIALASVLTYNMAMTTSFDTTPSSSPSNDETTAADIMTRNVTTVTEDMNVEDVLKILINKKITGLPVVDAKGKMVGIVSEYDLLKQLSSKKRLSPSDFQGKMQFSKTVAAITEDTPLQEIVRQFVDARYRRLPVIDNKGVLLGIITRRDLMRVFYYRAQLI